MTAPIQTVGVPGLGEWAIPRPGGGEWSVGAVDPGREAAKSVAEADPTGGFGSILGEAIEGLERKQVAAAEQARALATGETQDIASVVAAVQEASLSMQLAAQVRSKATEAYSEIFHTQV